MASWSEISGKLLAHTRLNLAYSDRSVNKFSHEGSVESGNSMFGRTVNRAYWFCQILSSFPRNELNSPPA